MAVIAFSGVIALMNGVLQPVVSATGEHGAAKQYGGSTATGTKGSSGYRHQAHTKCISARTEMVTRTSGIGIPIRTTPNHDNEGMLDGIGNDVKFWMAQQSYNFRNNIFKQWLSEVLEVVYAAASLCIIPYERFPDRTGHIRPARIRVIRL